MSSSPLNRINLVNSVASAQPHGKQPAHTADSSKSSKTDLVSFFNAHKQRLEELQTQVGQLQHAQNELASLSKRDVACLTENLDTLQGVKDAADSSKSSKTDLVSFFNAHKQRLEELQTQVAQLRHAQNELVSLSTRHLSCLTENANNFQGVNEDFNQLQKEMNSLNQSIGSLNQLTASLNNALFDVKNVDILNSQFIQDLLSLTATTMKATTAIVSLIQDDVTEDDISAADGLQHSDERSYSANGNDDIEMLRTAQQIATLFTQPQNAHLRLPEEAQNIIRTLYHVNCILQNDNAQRILTAPHPPSKANRSISPKESAAIKEQELKLKSIVPSYISASKDTQINQSSLQTAINSIEAQVHLPAGPRNNTGKPVNIVFQQALARIKNYIGTPEINSFAQLITTRAYGPILTLMALNLYEANRATRPGRSPSAQNTVQRLDRRVKALHNTLTALYALLPSSGTGTGARSSSTTAPAAHSSSPNNTNTNAQSFPITEQRKS